MGTSYEYKSLAPGSIRLLLLLPGSPEDDINVLLKEFPLEHSEGLYEAQSYTWAPTTPSKAIYCNGREIRITANLYDALVALRWVSEFRGLWIDQITINQQDNAEKNSQVKLMGTIYSKADHVLVWLSNHTWKDETVKDHIIEFDELCRRICETYSQAFSDRLTLDDAQEEDLLKIRPGVWNSVCAIYQSNYFRRVWMIQEVVRAKECFAMISGNLLIWKSMELMGSVLQQITFQQQVRSSLPNAIVLETLERHISSLQKMVTIR